MGRLPSEATMLEIAWGIIANASDWDRKPPRKDWIQAAERWRDDYHRWLDIYLGKNG